MKNKILIVFLFMLFIFSNFSFTTLAKDKLIIGLDPTFAPMGYIDEDGEYAGFDIDLAKIYAQKYNKEIEFKSINWDTKEIDLENENIDLVWNGLTYTEERAKVMELSHKYLDDNLVLVSLNEHKYEKFDDLKGKIVAVQTNSSAEKLAFENKELFSDIKSYPDYNQAMLNLKNKNVSGVIIDEIVAKYISKKENINIYVSSNILEKASFSVATKKGNTKLITEINLFLEEVIADGTITNLKNKWFESNPNSSKGIFSTFYDILKGLHNTLLVYIMTVLISFPASVLLVIVYLRENKILNKFISFYTWVFRGSPLMLQLFFFYYGLFPFFSWSISAIWCAIITFILNYLAYIFEILRGGVASVDKGQVEASYVLGYNSIQRFIYIILPQAIRVTLPSLANEAIALVKDTSLINVLAITEILLITKQIANRTATITPYIYAFIIYLILNAVIVFIFNKLESKYSIK